MEVITIEDTTPTERQIAATISELRRRYPDRDAVEIERWTRAEYWVHSEDPVQDFIPLLVMRAVADRLRCSPPGISFRPLD
jgi:hypothetical protein